MLSLHICHEQDCVSVVGGVRRKFEEEEEALSEGIPFVWICVWVCTVYKQGPMHARYIDISFSSNV